MVFMTFKDSIFGGAARIPSITMMCDMQYDG